MRPFDALASSAEPPLDKLALALAGEFRAVDEPAALARLDALGEEYRAELPIAGGDPEAEAVLLTALLGERHGFDGDREQYDRPQNSMLDVVLERRRGLPILLSVVYVEVARRARVPVYGVGLPGHFVVGHFGAPEPLLLDPFAGGARMDAPAGGVVRPWRTHEITLRMLNNLVGSLERRGDLGGAMRAAAMREALPAGRELRETLQQELRALHARLN